MECSLRDIFRKIPDGPCSRAEFLLDRRRGVEIKLPCREPEADDSPDWGSVRLAWDGRGEGTKPER